jgi:phage terminase large subunit-like protein
VARGVLSKTRTKKVRQQQSLAGLKEHIAVTDIAKATDGRDSDELPFHPLANLFPLAEGIGIKSYQRDRESFQGETLDYGWADEERPADIYTELLTRTNVSQGPVWITFTPLLGMSETVRRFLLEPNADRSVTTMTIDDVDHFSAEEKGQNHRVISGTRARGQDQGRPDAGQRAHLSSAGGDDRLVAARFPEIIGRGSSGMISAGIIPSLQLSSYGIAIPTPSTSPSAIGFARARPSFMRLR